MDSNTPFDIVWFVPEKAERALGALALLPGGEEERLARGLAHHFRGWRNAPAIKADGSRAPGRMVCVATNRPGSIALAPGAVDGQRVRVADHCRAFVEVEEGVIGAWIKDETWALPQFVKEAEEWTAREQRKVDTIRDTNTRAVQNFELRKSQVERAYYETIVNMTITGTKEPAKMNLTQLQYAAVFHRLSGVKMPSLKKWMKKFRIEAPRLVNAQPCDPLKFLDHMDRTAAGVMSSQ